MSQPIAVPRTNTRRGSSHEITAKTRYTRSYDTTGWLRVKLEASGESAFLPEFVKVAVTKESDRTHFMILEGRYKGKIASLSKENAAQCLKAAKRGNGAKLVAKIIGRKKLVSEPRYNEKLNQLIATLHFDGQQATITLDSDVDFIEHTPGSPNLNKRVHSKPLPQGIYKILAPESAGRIEDTDFYVTRPGGYPDLKYHTVWFPIEYSPTNNSNFVHVGNLSHGCVTMYQLEMWNPLYRYLISNRSDKDGKYVGTVTIE